MNRHGYGASIYWTVGGSATSAAALWMACDTQQEIAVELDRPRTTIECWLESLAEISNLPESAQTLANFTETFEDDKGETQPAFEVPIYNVWKKQNKTPGAKHFGNSEVLWAAPLLTGTIGECPSVGWIWFSGVRNGGFAAEYLLVWCLSGV